MFYRGKHSGSSLLPDQMDNLQSATISSLNYNMCPLSRSCRGSSVFIYPTPNKAWLVTFLVLAVEVVVLNALFRADFSLARRM